MVTNAILLKPSKYLVFPFIRRSYRSVIYFLFKNFWSIPLIVFALLMYLIDNEFLSQFVSIYEKLSTTMEPRKRCLQSNDRKPLPSIAY